MRKLNIGFLILLLATAGCGTVRVRTFSRAQLFQQRFATFAFKPPVQEFNPLMFAPRDQAIVKQEIVRALEAHGFRESESPDLLVGFYLRVRNRKFDLEHPTVEGDSPDAIMNTYFGFVFGSGKSLNQVSPIHYREGTLVVNLVDARNNRVVWEGLARGTIHPRQTPDQIKARIHEAVTKIFRKLPVSAVEGQGSAH
ncbi:MAG TPA: DUF4136 domain-containing protein [Verrucomicrobiae bacterium]|nr:DUF4136 domain-containing protein [Verrucomicrobiae bacterium]